MDVKKFTGKEGQLISAERALELTKPHLSREREIVGRGENFVKAEFFGIHTFNELIGLHGDNCVGFRVYYGVRDEDDNALDEQLLVRGNGAKKSTARLVIVPVGADGRDLTKSMHAGGLKDMAAEKEVMVGGPICPRQC
ncbi:hypothetical protein [Dyadobacter sp. Leaf189]|uniref:hypothetical protein n=1 Tax=Dyadobacter sp. Leaf189 TaxID=1736295 RepID=UPI0006FEC586|nr:hypothetical protein [Dyadobacter sp. Leaf189]KQS31460.1 hypothetical protein ASG33_14210 [Dyadobacter sp. Leaf189]